MSRARVTRHEMKHDEFVSTIGRATRWAEDHWRQMALALGAAVLVTLIATGVVWWRQRRNLQAEAALGAVTEAYHADLGAAAGDPSFPTDADRSRAVIERADEVIESYGSTPAGERARYYRALSLYRDGEVEEAARELDRFVERYPDHFLAAFARWKRAQIREQQGDLAGACEGYRALLDAQVPEFPSELAYLDLGRCLERSGQPGEAAATYRRLLEAYPESPYAADARQRLQPIEGEG
jgi:TolA-binding protein